VSHHHADDPYDDRGLLFRITRRNLLAKSALTAAAAGLGVACSKNSSASAAQDDAQTRTSGGELNVAFDGAGVTTFTLDPHNSGYAPHNRVMRSIYDSLTRLLPDQTVGPWLAESWEVSPDRKEYTFTLKQGVKFHDGTVFDAEAVKANFDRLAEPKNALSSISSLGPYERSEVLGSHKLKLVLKQPFTPLLRNLSMTKLGIVSPTAVAKYGATYALNPVATGPYKFVGMKQGVEIRLEKNPDYNWAPPDHPRQGPAYFEKLNFLNVPDETTRVAVLHAGQVLAADLIPPQNLPAFRADQRFTLLEKELLNTNYALWLNVSKAPWNDEDVRLAVRLAIDIDAIVRTIYLGNFPRAWSTLSPSMFGSAEKLLANSWKPDPARAREILTRRGWIPGPDGIRQKDGKQLLIRFIDSQGNREKRLDVLQVVRRQLQEVGIKLFLDSQPPGVIASALAENRHDMAGGASFHADPDILRQYYDPEARIVGAGARVLDDELIAWLRTAAQTPDGPERAEYYHKIQRKVLDKTYAIAIYILPYNVAVAKRLQGVTIDEHGFPEFRSAHFASEQA